MHIVSTDEVQDRSKGIAGFDVAIMVLLVIDLGIIGPILKGYGPNMFTRIAKCSENPARSSFISMTISLLFSGGPMFVTFMVFCLSLSNSGEQSSTYLLTKLRKMKIGMFAIEGIFNALLFCWILFYRKKMIRTLNYADKTASKKLLEKEMQIEVNCEEASQIAKDGTESKRVIDELVTSKGSKKPIGVSFFSFQLLAVLISYLSYNYLVFFLGEC